MKILQLCCFKNQFPDTYEVESWDLKNGKDIFNIPDHYANKFDLVCAAPPCDQFTKANALRWENVPVLYIEIAKRCFEICKQTGSLWFLENPPGRIEKFITNLTKYRIITWSSPRTNKEYVIYANFLIMQQNTRYGKTNIKRPKKTRELWEPELIIDICKFIK